MYVCFVRTLLHRGRRLTSTQGSFATCTAGAVKETKRKGKQKGEHRDTFLNPKGPTWASFGFRHNGYSGRKIGNPNSDSCLLSTPHMLKSSTTTRLPTPCQARPKFLVGARVYTWTGLSRRHLHAALTDSNRRRHLIHVYPSAPVGCGHFGCDPLIGPRVSIYSEMLLLVCWVHRRRPQWRA